MAKHISEELKARKYAPAGASKGDDEAKGGKEDSSDPEKQIKQAVYDIRYRARREEVPLRQAYSQYMQNSSLGEPAKKQIRSSLFGGDMKAEAVDLAIASSANALYKVFVEGVNNKEEIHLSYLQEMERDVENRKYKVRVSDKSGKSYVRYADRQKISELRANPNIKEVEMTEYGTPYEGERKRGEQTAAAKRGDNLDPVGKEDSDVNNDGKVNDQDKYLMKRREAIGRAMKNEENINEILGGVVKDIVGDAVKGAALDTAKKVATNPATIAGTIGYATGKKDRKLQKAIGSGAGAAVGGALGGPIGSVVGGLVGGKVAEEYLGEVVDNADTDENEQKIDKMKGKNKVIINPPAPGGGKRGMVMAHKNSEGPFISEAGSCGMDVFQDMVKKKQTGEIDPRSIKTAYNLAKNYARFASLRDQPAVMLPPDELLFARENEKRQDIKKQIVKKDRIAGRNVDEEAYDQMKDRRMERGGSGDRMERPMSDGRGKKPSRGDAMSQVKADLMKKYGRNVLMNKK